MAEHAVLRFPIAADLGPLRDQVRAFAAAREQHLTEMARLIETMMDSGIRMPSYDPQTAREIIETDLPTHPAALPSLPASADA